VALAAPLLLVGSLAGYAWNGWVGVAEAVAAVVVLDVGRRLLIRLCGRGAEVGAGARALVFAVPAGIVGYAVEGVLGALALGVLAWIAVSVGRGLGARMLARQEAARAGRLARSRRRRGIP
jgi:hypothetical protein